MFHLRFTPYDISGYTFNFLFSYAKYIVARELVDDSGNNLLHYHIMVDDDTVGPQTLRNNLREFFRIPPAGKGRNNRYYALITDWKDPGYICKYNDIIYQKGYTEKEIMEFVISGKKKYLDKVKRTELSGEVAPAVSPRPKKEPKVPLQQAVIASAAADWYNYKRKCIEEGDLPDKDMTIEFVCKAMREHQRGINQYMVVELARAVLYDDLDYRQLVLAKIKAFANL